MKTHLLILIVLLFAAPQYIKAQDPSADKKEARANEKEYRKIRRELKKDLRPYVKKQKKLKRLVNPKNVEKTTPYSITLEGTLTNRITEKPFENAKVELFNWQGANETVSDKNGYFRINTVFYDSVYKNFSYGTRKVCFDGIVNRNVLIERPCFTPNDTTTVIFRRDLELCPRNIDSLIIGMTIEQLLDTLGLTGFTPGTKVVYPQLRDDDFNIYVVVIELREKGLMPLQLYTRFPYNPTKTYGPAIIENFMPPFRDELFKRKIEGTGLLYYPDRNSDAIERYINIEEKNKMQWSQPKN